MQIARSQPPNRVLNLTQARVTEYLQAVMNQDPAFAQEVQRLAGQVVNISSIADQRTVQGLPYLVC